MTTPNWITEEFARATERTNSLPPHARIHFSRPLASSKGTSEGHRQQLEGPESNPSRKVN